MRTSVFVMKTALAGALLASIAGAEGQKDLPAVKGIYLDREHHPTMNGMRFDIVLQQPDGSKAEVPVTFDFHTGDRFWLRMDMRNSAYVYVLNRTLPGGDKGIEAVRIDDQQRAPEPAQMPHLVFGPEKLNHGAARLAPKGKNMAMRFDRETGVEKLYVIVSPKPLQLEAFFGADGKMAVDATHHDAMQQLDQRLSEWNGNAQYAYPDKEGAKGIYQDNYGYCVERQPDRPFMFEITLNHRPKR